MSDALRCKYIYVIFDKDLGEIDGSPLIFSDDADAEMFFKRVLRMEQNKHVYQHLELRCVGDVDMSTGNICGFSEFRVIDV